LDEPSLFQLPGMAALQKVLTSCFPRWRRRSGTRMRVRIIGKVLVQRRFD